MTDQYLFKIFEEKFKSDSHYYGDFFFVTNSQLSRFKKSPQTYIMYKEQKLLKDVEPYITARHFGRAYHMAMLEPDIYDENVIRVDASTRTAKAWKEAIAEHNGKVSAIILNSEHYNIMRMRDVLYGIKEIADLLIGEGENEGVKIWKDQHTDVYCKCKVDRITSDNIMVDLKTTTDCSLSAFKSSVFKYGYNRQAPFYLDGSGAKEFVFVVQEKSAPYNVALYETSPSFLNYGREEYKNLLNDFKEYIVDEKFDVKQSFKKAVL